jgi:spermidine/putrescine transport system ATP-binding protein
LLDEPLAALDAHLREQMQMELKRLQTRLRTTFVMVTHDQSEALSISDRIVVLNNGVIEQIASPASLYDAPATPFVAKFIGAMNILEGVVVERRGTEVLVHAAGLAVVARSPDDGPVEPGTKVTIAFRPESVSLSTAGPDQAAGGRIQEVAFHGRMLRVHIVLSAGASAIADIPRTTGGRIRAGDELNPGAVVMVRVAEGVTRILAVH